MSLRPGVLTPESSEPTSPLCFQEGVRQGDRGLLGFGGTSGLRRRILALYCGASYSVLSEGAQASVLVPRMRAAGRALWETDRGPETETGQCPFAVIPDVHRRVCRLQRETSAVGTSSLRLDWAVVAGIVTDVAHVGGVGGTPRASSRMLQRA